MSANATTAAPAGRKKLAQGKERSDAALGHDSQNTSSPEGAKEGGELPKNWRWVTLGDVVESMKNGIYKPASSYADNGLACLRMYNIGDGKIVWRDIKRMLLSEDEIREYELLPGDLLVNRVNSRELVGKSVAIPAGLERCVFESKNIRVRIRRELVSPEFVSYRLLSAGSRYFTQNAQQVVGMASISQPQVARFPLPLPPLPEQQRIVAEIEKQFTRLEAGVAALRRVQANLKRYRAAVLKAACEGRLVPTEAERLKAEGRGLKDFESGEQLLKRILTERRQNWQVRGKYKEPAAPEPLANAELPKGWVWTGFEQLADGTKNAIKAGPFGSSLKKSFYTPSGFKIYGQEQVIKSDAYFGDYFISRELFEHLQSCEVKPGDILISLVGTTGKVLILPDDCAPGIINPRLLKLSLNRSGVNAKFIKFLLESSTTRAFFKLAAHGGTMEILNLGILKTLPIALPPLAEQTRIVAEVERRLSVVEELESVVSANLQRAVRLRQSILQKAFTGHLV